MEEVCYYIIENAISSKKGDLIIGSRIFAVNTCFPIIPLTNGEGPFSKLNYLIENSLIFRDLKTKNSKRAHKIIQDEYIVKIKNGVLVPKNTTFKAGFIDALQHSLSGEIKNEKLKGIHFFDEKKTRIIQFLDSNKRGVWSAIIESQDKNGNWIKKENPTTFFPKKWNEANMLEELNYAVNNIKLKVGSENIYEARTITGILVEIVIVNGKMKTIYPILET